MTLALGVAHLEEMRQLCYDVLILPQQQYQEIPMPDLPQLDTDYQLTSDQIAQYRRDGHILLRGVASPVEVAAYEPSISAAVERFTTEVRPLADRETYGKAFLQVMNLWVRDEMVRRYVLARRFAKIAADLMRVSGVRIYHDQALYKEPGGGRTPWHQDQYYWPLDTDNTLTMWMPLIDITSAMGTLTFASRSGENGYLSEIPISDESERYFQQYVEKTGYPLATNGDMTAGDASFHSGWVLHAAPGNTTRAMRKVMTIIYFADGARVTTPDNPNRERDLRQWLSGVTPGNLAAGALNPVAYRE
jgi:ectoine hydroxylase-related dioxygenase (phytanoyl-CoA dioxygenase family)